jgi:hypothetical protein
MSDTAAGVVEAWIESGVEHLALGSALLTKKSRPAPVAASASEGTSPSV